ncbi:MAG: bifunctional hydroxymethylpyrimidine kinase/phosphomethylpyrimidine kinase [Acidobacteria bacterium]|nr:MAG: bifunctional hydroxymethylpyrimidine kinase/phosphomethylpyrimidine kinase [Acidobacteriota bacterium]
MIKSIQPPVVLTVAGLDPSGGAGILADIKTISAFGCYGVAAVTSLTFQNTRLVYGTLDQGAETVRRQIEPLVEDFEIAAIKTGMLPSSEVIREIAATILRKAAPVVVVDPVLRSSSGFDLVNDQAVGALTSCLFPLAEVVTPNVAEAARLTGLDIRNQTEMERAAAAILKLGSKAVLITGGDGDSDFSADLLVDAQGTILYTTERIRSKHTHGTGCTLASGLACLLARGLSLRESIPIVKRYINAAILSAPGLGHGDGPLNHCPPGFEIES